MKLLTTDHPKVKEYLGTVNASTVQTKNMFEDIGAGFKSLVGGKLGAYDKLLKEARVIVTNELIKEAEALGANAIIGIRYATSSIAQGASEVLIYGTAVII